MRMRVLAGLFAPCLATSVYAQSKPLERAVAGTSNEARADHIVQGGVRLFLVRAENGVGKLFVQGPGGNQRVVFDPTTVDGKPELAWADIANDGTHAIVGLQRGPETDVVVIDAKSGQFGTDRFAKASAPTAWLAPNRIAYHPADAKPKTLRVHELGADGGKDFVLPVPNDRLALRTAPGSTFTIAVVLDDANAGKEVYVVPTAKLTATTKWQRLTDASITKLSSYALDGNDLYFVSSAQPNVVRKLALTAPTAKASTVIDAKAPVASLGATGKTVIYTTTKGDAQQLWELDKSASTATAQAKEIALPSAARFTYFTDPTKQEVLITTTGTDNALALYRYAGGAMTPVPVVRSPAK